MHARMPAPAAPRRTTHLVAGFVAAALFVGPLAPGVAQARRKAPRPKPAAPAGAEALTGAPTAPVPPAPPAIPALAPGKVMPAVPASVPGPEARALDEKLQSLMARPGGLTADEAARRAEERSIDVTIRRAEIDSAAAQVDQAFVAFFPRLSGLARYSRLSPVDAGTLGGGGGSLVGTQIMTNTVINGVQFLNPCSAAVTSNCDPLVPLTLSFPVLLNQYVLQASLSVPLSDYVLRSMQGLAAASASRRAALINEQATRLKVRSDARVLYYNWARTLLQEVVTAQTLAQVRGHLADMKQMYAVGMVSPADVMRLESQAASAELVFEKTRNMARVMSEQLAIAMMEPKAEPWQIGEDLRATLSDLPEVGDDPAPLVSEALEHRLEPQALDENKNAIHEQSKVVRAGQYPRLDAVGNLAYLNPNQRIIPLQDKFSMNWDVGVSLSWSPNDVGIARANARNIDAQVVQLESQRRNLINGVRAEVIGAWSAMREARTLLDTTRRGLAASEEAYRVRQELWKVGRATAVELTDAETDLAQARLAAVNAGIDLRVAAVKLLHALGRDIPAK